MTSYTASFTKLSSGEWGVRVLGGDCEKGDEIAVRVTKRSGETKTFEGTVIWTGTDNRTGQPCALLASSGGSKPRGRSNGSYRYRGKPNYSGRSGSWGRQPNHGMGGCFDADN